MKERRTRFEVGYGLERRITDGVAAEILDHTLKPIMRKGKIKKAIIESLKAISSKKNIQAKLYTVAYGQVVRNEEPTYTDKLLENTREREIQQLEKMVEFNIFNGIYPYLCFIVFIIFLGNIRTWYFRYKAKRLRHIYHQYDFRKDLLLKSPKVGKKRVWLTIIFGLNPGIFFVIGESYSDIDLTSFVFLILFMLIPMAIFIIQAKRYNSKENYEEFLENKRDFYMEFLQKGYVTDEGYGYYPYTKSYYSSPEYAASRRRSSSSSGFSSSSSSSSSSSGGGSSGGGGASSGW